MVDGDQCRCGVSDEHLVALRKPNVRKLRSKCLLGCSDFGSFVTLNPPRQADSATGIDTLVLEPGLPGKLRGVGFEGGRVQGIALDHSGAMVCGLVASCEVRAAADAAHGRSVLSGVRSVVLRA